MNKYLFCFALAAGAAFAQYKMEPAGPPPSDLAPAFAAEMQQQGYKIVNSSGTVWCEIWLRKVAPSGPKSTEDGVALPTIPQGALLGVLRFPGQAADRRGQTIKPGLYTMRYSLYPVNGDHQGVAPNRDFALLVPASEDKDPAATPNFDALVALSRKASGTPHPAVFNIWNSSSDKLPSLEKQGDHDWVLNAKLGDQPLSIILIGKVES
ncbi:MAG TPA: hypothetical protein VFA33_25640 [Bryobacteraceae bacterium]|nr:hypothetical protein [Bryobacteraceae bacterium]